MSWAQTPLGNLVSISKGKKHSPSLKGAYRYINIEDLHRDINPQFTNDEGVLCGPNDLIIAWDGANAGKVGVGFEGVIGSTLARLKLKKTDVDAKFLFWFLEAKNEIIKSQRTGATIPHINGSSLKELEIPLPPLPVQQRIAEILDTADALRRKDQELLKKYDELAQAIFIDMFGDPVKNNKKWPIVKLNDVCLKITDGTHQSPKYTNTGVPFLFVSNIINNEISYKTDTYISQDEYEMLSSRTPIEVGNIILSTVGSYGNPAIMETTKEFAFQRHIAYIKPNHDLINYRYLFGFLRSPIAKQEFDKKVNGVAQKTLNLRDLKELPIWNVPRDIQDTYSSILTGITQQRTYISDKQTTTLFNSLMQKAFAGELVS